MFALNKTQVSDLGPLGPLVLIFVTTNIKTEKPLKHQRRLRLFHDMKATHVCQLYSEKQLKDIKIILTI